LRIENHAEVHLRLNQVNVQGQGPPVTSGSLVHSAQRLQGRAEVGMIGRRPLVGSNCLADQLDGNLVAAHLVSQHSQQVQAVSVMRIGIENSPVDSLRFRQLPATMEANGIAAHAVQVNQRTLLRRLALPAGNKIQGATHAASLCV